MEIEAKYRAVKRIKAGQVEAVDLGSYTLGPRIKHNLRDTLLDTDDLAISLQQYALRIRRDGAQSFVTLKGPALVEGGTHKREEWEVLLDDGADTDLTTWPADIQERVQKLIKQKPLQPLIEIRNRRRSWDIFREEQRVGELVLDRGTIRAGKKKEQMHEIEVELKDEGTEEDLAAIVALLSATLPLEAEPRSKSKRGLALLSGEPAARLALNKAIHDATPMQADALLAEAGRSILAEHLLHLFDHLPIAREGSDPEGVHQTRVAMRRMRSVLAVLGETVYNPEQVRKLRKGLKALAGVQGPVRDADVFLMAFDEYAADITPEEQAELKPLYEIQHQRRQAGRQAMLKMFDSKNTARFLAELTHFVTTPGEGVLLRQKHEDAVPRQLVRDFASSILWNCYEDVRAYESAMADAPATTFHRMRIDVKRLRYNFNLFRLAFGEGFKKWRKILGDVQDHLGDLNDAAVATELLDEVLEAHPNNQALQAYHDSRVAIHDELWHGAPAAIAPLLDITFRKQLASLLAEL